MEHPLTIEWWRWGKYRWSGVAGIRCMGNVALTSSIEAKIGGGAKSLMKNSVCAQLCSIADASQHNPYARLVMENPQLMIDHLSSTCIPGELCLQREKKIGSGNVPSHSCQVSPSKTNQSSPARLARCQIRLYHIIDVPKLRELTLQLFERHIWATTFAMNLVRESEIKAPESSVIRRKNLANPV